MSESKAEKKSHPVTRFVGDVLSTEKKIGDLNGKWAVMLKMTVLVGTVIAPLILAWSVWVTSSIFATTHHIVDTVNFRERIVHMERELSITPDRIKELEKDYSELKTDVKQLKEMNSIEHQNIGKQLNNNTQNLSIQLTRIQTQLEEIQKQQQ